LGAAVPADHVRVGMTLSVAIVSVDARLDMHSC
jgi:hypothetical protein